MHAPEGTIVERIFEWTVDTISVAAAFILIYLATAPPIVAGGMKSGHLSVLYSPIIYLIESDFNAPALWYFKVWGYELMLIGDTPSLSWGVILAYCFGIGLLGTAMLLPTVRRLRNRPNRTAITAKQSAPCAQ